MSDTPVSLLQRLKTAPAREGWDRLVSLYTPLLYYWARKQGLQEADAADLVQDVLTVLVRELPRFEYDRDGSFRNWLRTVLLNRLRQLRRRPSPAALEADVEGERGPDFLDEAEYRARLTARAMEIMQSQFQEKTWRACQALVVEERPGAEVAAELGMNLDAVYAARSRVLRKLRQELDGLFE
jgi:RNA polymerase sigma-70 factor (ECF subfamily)